MSKSLASPTKSASLKKTKTPNLNDTNLSTTQKMNLSRISHKSEIKSVNKSTTLNNSSNDIKIQFLAKNKKETGDQYIRSSVKEELRCKICKNLFVEPVCCYKCYSIYCFGCIKRETDTHFRCPSCFNIVFSEMMMYVEADYKENYKKYSVNCPHEGCKESYNLNEIKQHLETCLFRIVNNTEKIQKISYSNATKVVNHLLRKLMCILKITF